MHHRRTHARHTGFSLTDLGATIVLLAILLGVALPIATTSAREQANRVKCASNLRQIGLAMIMYANENRGSFPRARFDGAAEPAPTHYTAPFAANPFAEDGPGPNDVTAAMFLLLRTQQIEAFTFVCPTDGNAGPWIYDRTTESYSNFPARGNLSYGLHNPYPGEAVRAAGFRWTSNLTGEFAIAADMGPNVGQLTTTSHAAGRREMAWVNSRNHRGEGQNVLYGDGHAEFSATPYCGSPRPAGFVEARDNIYTAGNADGGSPWSTRYTAMADPFDSVILPLSDVGPEPTLSAMTREAWLFGGGGMALLAVIGVCSWLMARRHSAPRGPGARTSVRNDHQRGPGFGATMSGQCVGGGAGRLRPGPPVVGEDSAEQRWSCG